MVTIQKNNTRFDLSDSGNTRWFENNLTNGNWENGTFKIVDLFAHKSKYLIDIGAWLGPITLYSSDKYEHIYAFECDTSAYTEISNNIAANNFRNITLSNKGISNKTGISTMIDRGAMGNSTSSILGSALNENIEYSNKWEVNTITLEKYISDIKLDTNKINLIKMDIEGGEYDAIEGMVNYLKESKPNLLISLHYHLLKADRLEELIVILFDIYDFVYTDTLKLISKEELIKVIPHTSHTIDILLTSRAI